MTAAYAPLLAWGPLLAVTTLAYHLRRRSQRVNGGADRLTSTATPQ